MFIGREEQLHDLNSLMRKKTASLVTCRGRRRIGKSSLIIEFGKSAARFLEFVDGHHDPRKSDHEDGKYPRPALVGNSPGVLRRVKGALATLAGFAALDPSSALQARR